MAAKALASRGPGLRKGLALAVAALVAAAIAALYFLGPKEGWVHKAVLCLVAIGLIGTLLEPFVWLVGLARGKRRR